MPQLSTQAPVQSPLRGSTQWRRAHGPHLGEDHSRMDVDHSHVDLNLPQLLVGYINSRQPQMYSPVILRDASTFIAAKRCTNGQSLKRVTYSLIIVVHSWCLGGTEAMLRPAEGCMHQRGAWIRVIKRRGWLPKLSRTQVHHLMF